STPNASSRKIIRINKRFNPTKVKKNDLWLLCMFDDRHQNGYENVAWVIAKWMKRKGDGTQKESQIYYGRFILKLARKCMGNPQHALKDKGVIDSGCSKHITGNVSYLSEFKAINGGYVAFGGNPKGGKITGVTPPKMRVAAEYCTGALLHNITATDT
nr:ribonuclease H-like domain-containing protein [Tanacetum cinerariifolium]